MVDLGAAVESVHIRSSAAEETATDEVAVAEDKAAAEEVAAEEAAVEEVVDRFLGEGSFPENSGEALRFFSVSLSRILSI